jgi:hypothetical protein
MWRQNVRYAGGGLEYRTMDPWWRTLETHTRLEVNAADDLAGLPLYREAIFYLQTKLEGFWYVGADVTYKAPRLDDREVGDGTALERARGVLLRGHLATDPRGKVALAANAGWTLVSGGYVASADAVLTLRPLTQLDLELLPQVQSSGGEPRYALDGPGGQHLYAPLRADSVSATLRATYTFTPRLSLLAYAQAYVAAGHYGGLLAARSGLGREVHLGDLSPAGPLSVGNPDFEQGAVNVNTSLRWEYRLGSVLSLVYARAQYPRFVLGPTEQGMLDLRAFGRAPAVDVLFLKLGYFWG